METSAISLIPPLIVILLVIFTRRVIISISAGIISGALILCSFQPEQAVKAIAGSALQIVYTDGIWNFDNILLILFILGLGVLTAFIDKNGGTAGFAKWAEKRVKNAVGAQLLAFVLGIIIFIDDYFNALTVGEVSRSLTDRYKVSREKLAYIIDSTSAPVCSICPLSSWGAYIIALFAVILPRTAAPLNQFIATIPYNFYAIFSLAVVAFSALWNINLGRMNDTASIKESQDDTASGHEEHASDLVLPIGILVVVSMGTMYITGRVFSGSWDIFQILQYASTYLALCAGCLTALLYTLYRYWHFHGTKLFSTARAGIMKVAGATAALLFAWVLIDMIAKLQPGTFLSGLLVAYHISPQLLPCLLFIFSAVMALATGFSWGVFGIMLPISVQMASTLGLETTMLYCCLGAVLSGAVFGDHCSPISDTTILSSTGAQCVHIDHVISQMPYALFSAAVAAVGFLAIGYTNSLGAAFAVQVLLLAAVTALIVARRSHILERQRRSPAKRGLFPFPVSGRRSIRPKKWKNA